MVCPTLISVSLAPGSYFFWALAAETDSARVSAVAVARCRIPFLIRNFLILFICRWSTGCTARPVPSLRASVAEWLLQRKAGTCPQFVGWVSPAAARSAVRWRNPPLLFPRIVTVVGYALQMHFVHLQG